MSDRKVTDLRIDGVCTIDAPDFCDAYFYYGRWEDTGEKLTDAELNKHAKDNPELLNEMAFEEYL